MKIRIEVDPNITEEELVLKCANIDERILKLKQYLSGFEDDKNRIVFFKDNTEFYFPVDEVLFFETFEDSVMAHTASDVFEVKFKLYELQNLLPAFFLRVSKSTIVNTGKVYSITKNLAGASRVEFAGTNKFVYVSRNYYPLLKESLVANYMNKEK